MAWFFFVFCVKIILFASKDISHFQIIEIWLKGVVWSKGSISQGTYSDDFDKLMFIGTYPNEIQQYVIGLNTVKIIMVIIALCRCRTRWRENKRKSKIRRQSLICVSNGKIADRQDFRLLVFGSTPYLYGH